MENISEPTYIEFRHKDKEGEFKSYGGLAILYNDKIYYGYYNEDKIKEYIFDSSDCIYENVYPTLSTYGKHIQKYYENKLEHLQFVQKLELI